MKIPTWKKMLVILVIFVMVVQNFTGVIAAPEEAGGSDIEERAEPPEETVAVTTKPNQEVTEEDPQEQQREEAVETEVVEVEPEDLAATAEAAIFERAEEVGEEVSAVGSPFDQTNLLNPYLTNFSFINEVNNLPFNDTDNMIQVDSYVKIHYDFRIPNDSRIPAGTKFTLQLPSVFRLGNDYITPMELKTNTPGLAGVTWTVTADGLITLIFNEATTVSNIEGEFNISAQVDRIKLTETVTFVVNENYPGTGIFKGVPEDENARNVQLDKTFRYISVINRVEWNIALTLKNTRTLAGFTLTERWDPNQLKLYSIYLDSTTAENKITNYTEVKNDVGQSIGFNYTFPEGMASGDHNIIVTTELSDDIFLNYASGNTSSYAGTQLPQVTNYAEIWNKTKPLDSDSAVITWKQSAQKITKTVSGTNIDKRTITYDIVTNLQHLDISKGFAVKDIYPAGLAYKSVKITKESVGNITDETAKFNVTNTPPVGNGTGIVEFRAIDKKFGEGTRGEITVQVTFEVTDMSRFTEENTATRTYKIPNTAECWYSNGAYASVTNNEGVGVGWGTQYISVKKTSNILQYNVKQDEQGKDTGQVESDWIVKIDNLQSQRNQGRIIVFEDTLPKGQSYVANSFRINDNAVADDASNLEWGTDNKGCTTIKYTLNEADKASGECRIAFTVITNLADAAIDGDGMVINIAKVSDGQITVEEEGTLRVITSGRLAKESTAYDANTKAYTWTVFVNSKNSVMEYEKAIITDTLPENHVLKGGVDSIKISRYDLDGSLDKELTTAERDALFDITYDVATRKIIFKVKETLTDVYHIVLQSEIANGETQLRLSTNEVNLTAKRTIDLHASATCEVIHDIPIQKGTEYKAGSSIEWTVKLNWHAAKNTDLTVIEPGSILEDVLPLNLQYVEGTMKLQQWKRDNDNEGGYWSSVVIDKGDKNVVYDKAANKISYTIPSSYVNSGTVTPFYKLGAYVLSFQTKILWETGTTTANTCSFTNVGVTKSSTIREVELKATGVSASIKGDNISLTVNKSGEDENGERSPLAGAEFTLYEADGKTKAADPVTTEGSGIVRFSAGMLFKHTYYLKETVVPEGRDQAALKDAYKIDIADGNAKSAVEMTVTKLTGSVAGKPETFVVERDEAGFFPLELNIVNKPQPPAEAPDDEGHPDSKDVSIRKTDITGQNEVVGATLTIYEQDATKTGGKGKKIESWTSGTKPHTVAGSKLEVGKIYILEETHAPDGYAYTESIKFQIDKAGVATLLASGTRDADGNIVMKDKKTKVTFKKTDAAGVALAGATLTIYVKKADGSIGQQITHWTTTVAEKVHAVEGLLNVGQEYILVETNVPSGYTQAADIHFTINRDGTAAVTGGGIKDKDGNIVVVDELLSIKIAKVSSLGRGLAGAKLAIYETDADGHKTNTIAKNRKGQKLSWTSTVKEKEFTGILAGKYVLHEIDSPKGYQLAADIIFTVNTDGTVTKVGDEGKVRGITIIMVDNRETALKPEDMSLEITKEVTGSKGSKTQEFTFTIVLTDADGKELTGTYVYVKNEKQATVKSGGTITLSHGQRAVLYSIAEGTIYKVTEGDNAGYTVKEDNTSGTLGADLATAAFTNSKGKPSGGNDDTTTTTSKKTTLSSYGSNGKTAKTVENVKTVKTVKTGDTTAIMLWVLICIGGAAGIIFLTVRRRKRNK